MGATINIDVDYMENHRQPDLHKIKGALVSEVDVTFFTTLNNKITLTVGMYYMPKSMSRDESYTHFKDMMKDVEVCANCVETIHSTESIFIGGYCCSAYCAECVNQMMVCNNCQLLEHTSHNVSAASVQ